MFIITLFIKESLYEIFIIGFVMDLVYVDKIPIYLISITIIFVLSSFLRKRMSIHV